MLNEHIRKDAGIKLYPSRQEQGDYVREEQLLFCEGKIHKVVSASEIEIVTDREVTLQKNICYILYIFLAQEVFMGSCYFRLSSVEEEKQVLFLELVSPLERVQRRMHQRVSCHSRVRYRQLSKEEAVRYRENSELFTDIREQQEAYENSLVDISGGGIRFISKTKIPVDDYLLVCFEITNEKRAVEMRAIGQVVFSMPLRNEQDSYDIRMKYVGLTEEERKQIIHFVFQLERDSINNRWQRGGGFA